MTPSLPETLQQSVAAVREYTALQARVGLVLGSGLGDVAGAMTDAVALPYAQIPHFQQPQVAGHAGQMLVGQWAGVPVAVLQGRFHFYEGHSMADTVFPVRVLCALGVEAVLLTNAAGGVNPQFRAGDLMAISDHLNLTGDNPLRGPNDDALGPRFPDMTQAYDAACLQVLQDAARETGIALHTGVYAGLSGPTYETPAEVRMLRTLGADAVGMSTVAECIAARHMGVRVAGLSCITNMAAGLSSHPLSHQEVMDASRDNAAKLTRLLRIAVPRFVA